MKKTKNLLLRIQIKTEQVSTLMLIFGIEVSIEHLF